MGLEAVVQDLYPANLFQETNTFSAYDDNFLPNFSFDSFISQELLLNDCSYGCLINNNNADNNDTICDYNYNYEDKEDHQVWAAKGTNINVNYSMLPEGNGECYTAPMVVTRLKRRRTRPRKNKDDIENQRMTHIAVERNRRRQMNHYLALLRSLMPHSYVQRGDQASIVGGAINYVKELEHNLQCLSAKKHNNNNNSDLPFGEFFTFPQFSTVDGNVSTSDDKADGTSQCGGGEVMADVEVTMVESYALVKIRSKRPPKQLSKLVKGLQGLRLTVLHLNLTKVDGVALYSFSLKVEDESKISSVDEIAGAMHQLLCRMQE